MASLTIDVAFAVFYISGDRGDGAGCLAVYARRGSSATRGAQTASASLAHWVTGGDSQRVANLISLHAANNGRQQAARQTRIGVDMAAYLGDVRRCA